MPMTQEGPFFNLKAVVQQTGLKPDTLRAWERRYGVPAPRRSAGGHRLYTRHDIQAIRWLMTRQEEGLSIKRAVELWQQIESEGLDPLQTPGFAAPPAPSPILPHALGGSLVHLAEDWVAACLAYDEQRAEQILALAFALYPAETVCLDMLGPALSRIGEGWYRGEMTVQQEHFASALAIRRLEALIAAAAPPTRPGRVLAACPPHEHHVFGLLVLAYLLRRRGWEVVYLGADMPMERLETTVATTHSRLVILAAQQLHTAATLVEAAELLHKERTPLAYGGLIFNLLPDLRRRVPGHFLGESLAAAALAAESLITLPRPTPTAEPVAETWLQARQHYAERRWQIESEVEADLVGSDIVTNHLETANQELERNISAALRLGNIDFVGTDITWLEGLMANHLVPTDQLRAYLNAYLRSAKMHMDKRGQPIVDWLAHLVSAEPGPSEAHAGAPMPKQRRV